MKRAMNEEGFFFIKKINNNWLEDERVLDDVREYYRENKQIIGKHHQSRKCTDLFRIHLINLPSEYSEEFVEELKYRIKMAIIKLEYQRKKERRSELFRFSEKINELGQMFIKDCEYLVKLQTNETEKLTILKKIMTAFKNALNQIYIINY
ncbi:MAG: hypothetical protein NZL96_00420 [Patescibacteria group bacterium]|nr:hypothetical protein [Patescibacteria group bacterium]